MGDLEIIREAQELSTDLIATGVGRKDIYRIWRIHAPVGVLLREAEAEDEARGIRARHSPEDA